MAKPKTLPLQRQLVLAHWAAREFGYDSPKALRDDLREAGEGFGADGWSPVGLRLRSRPGLRIPESELRQYEDALRGDLRRMNAGRREPITLRYFQHLAALASEHFLHRRATGRRELLESLNRFRSGFRSSVSSAIPRFEDPDLDRLCFWMATGSGKTLLLHLHYFQFLRHHRKALDNILLVAPNEALSAQHLEEAAISGVPARRFDAPSTPDQPDAVRAIEITKLAEEKKGQGVTVPVEAFAGNNLVFVDEGHKGSGGEAWRKVRDALAETGFTFEYSATFGQALAAAGKAELVRKYGKSILFDYSYRWFHRDGYGKEFRVLNLEGSRSDFGDDPEPTHTLLLAGLLSFFEQRLTFDAGDRIAPYRIERPLWVFVGGTVNALYRRKKRQRSDVLTVCLFFHRFLGDRDWAVNTIRSVLGGTAAGVLGVVGDPFADWFPRLREGRSADPAGHAEELYRDMLGRLFHARSGGGLEMRSIRGADGEIAIRAQKAERDFGVIYVGDRNKLVGRAEQVAPELVGPEQVVGESLFATINDPDSPVEVLIGARRFIEGWNSWRVSGMGLLNLGRVEGSQIIQLFGRGVRLRGRDFSLKRSTAGDHPARPRWLPLLETLNVFGIRADFMAAFHKALAAEKVVPESVPVPIRVREELLDEGLFVPRVVERARFRASGSAFEVIPETAPTVHLDLLPRLRRFRSTAGALSAAPANMAGTARRRLPEDTLHLVDWQAVSLDLVKHANRNGYGNLVLRPDEMRETASRCTLAAGERMFAPRSPADRERLQEVVTALLRTVLDRDFRRRRERWESRRLVFRKLDRTDGNLAFPGGDGNRRVPTPCARTTGRSRTM